MNRELTEMLVSYLEYIIVKRHELVHKHTTRIYNPSTTHIKSLKLFGCGGLGV